MVGRLLLEVPVAGGPLRAAKGDAFYMVSGDEAACEKARPYLEAAASKILFAGAFGNAAKLKLALNVLTNLSFAASLEGMLLARAMGLPQELYEEGGQATTMLNPLLLQYLSPYKMREAVFRSENLQSYLRGRMEIAQKDLGLALRASWLNDTAQRIGRIAGLVVGAAVPVSAGWLAGGLRTSAGFTVVAVGLVGIVLARLRPTWFTGLRYGLLLLAALALLTLVRLTFDGLLA